MVQWKIPLFKTYSDEDDLKAVCDVLKRGTYWAVGPEIEEFEKKIAEYIGTEYALTFNSGTSALHTLLLAYGIQGKEIIVPSFSFIATANPVLIAGGIPVFAESESETFGLDAEDVKKKITKNTKAIIALHYGGIPSRDIEKLRQIADENNLILIEDAAESIGSKIGNKKIGSFGDSAMISFCQNKVLATGEGGILLTSSKEIYEKAKLLRSHGRVEEEEDYFSRVGDNDYVQPGYNFRMPTIIAALGLAQFKKINKIIESRRNAAKYLSKYLSQLPGVIVPKEIEGHFQVYQMYTIQIEDSSKRDELMEHLKQRGIMNKVYFNPIHLKTIFKKRGSKEGDLPKTEELSKRVVNLPLYPEITKEDLDYIIESIKEFFQQTEMRELDKILINPHLPIKEAVGVIDRGGIKLAVVVDETNKLLGIVTDSDVRRGILRGVNINEEVSTIMNPSPVYVTNTENREEILFKLMNKKIAGFGIPLINQNSAVIDIILFDNRQAISYLNKYPKKKSKLDRILVIGGGGFIGSILVRELLLRGYKVNILDKFIYGEESIKDLYQNTDVKIIRGDTRHIEDILLSIEEVDAVVHLAELVGDPSCDLFPNKTIEVNNLATKTIALICKQFQINRLVYASSCSVYGASKGESLLTEESALSPVSLYAKLKIASEEALLNMKDENFLPTILRLATVFGSSYRPRFDLVVNTLTAQAIVQKKINIFGGNQWRPNVHVRDVASAIIKVLESPLEVVGGQIFNIGSEENNYTINQIGEIVKNTIPNSELNLEERNIDLRDYKISFKKLREILNLTLRKSVFEGVLELKKDFEDNKISNYLDKKYSNVKVLEENYKL